MIIRGAGVTDGNPVFGWDNLVTTSNISATVSDVALPASNLANPSTHLYWGGAIPATAYLQVSGLNNTVSYLAIANHNFGDIGVALTVETTLNGSTWTAQTTPQTVADNKPLIFQFAPVTNCLGVRLKMTGAGTEFALAAVLYAGSITTMERSLRIDVNHTPINLGVVSDVVNGMSEAGHFLGRLVRNQYLESKMDFYFFQQSFYAAEVDPFIRHAVDKPFFVATAPATATSVVGYCWLTKDPKPEIHLATDRVNVSLEMRGFA